MVAPILFGLPEASDADLAEVVAARLGCVLPADCVAGVASNARLLQHHADILARGEA